MTIDVGESEGSDEEREIPTPVHFLSNKVCIHVMKSIHSVHFHKLCDCLHHEFLNCRTAVGNNKLQHW